MRHCRRLTLKLWCAGKYTIRRRAGTPCCAFREVQVRHSDKATKPRPLTKLPVANKYKTQKQRLLRLAPTQQTYGRGAHLQKRKGHEMGGFRVDQPEHEITPIRAQVFASLKKRKKNEYKTKNTTPEPASDRCTPPAEHGNPSPSPRGRSRPALPSPSRLPSHRPAARRSSP